MKQKTKILIILLFLGIGISSSAQNETSVTDRKTNKEVNKIKKLLIKNSKKGKPKKTQTKRILNVAWFDTNFNKIETSPRGELISIAVLTEGYAIGDKMEITIGSDEPENESLIEGIDCKKITFIGKVNYKNIAFLQNIFTVEGEKEQMIIAPNWKERYICK